ncbi:MAG: SIS domain-containing protein [Anaerolineaceae bacterium]|nr:SIS domain-containing protein [Anaerolineaceae bacterium]
MDSIERYLDELRSALDGLPLETIDQVVNIIHEARVNGRQVFVMGNGGSASTATHFVCDLAKNTKNKGWPNIRAIGLTDNIAMITAYANDDGYDNMMVEQLANFVQPRDVVLGISTSGNSSNVVKAIELANHSGAITIGFTGRSGGKLSKVAQVNVSVNSDLVQQLEDAHMMLCHMVTNALNCIPKPVEVLTGQPADAGLTLVKDLFGEAAALGQASAARTLNSLELINKVSQDMAENLNLHDLLSNVLQFTISSVGANSGSVIVMDENGDVVDGIVAYAGKVNQTSLEGLDTITKQGLAGWVLSNRTAALVESTRDDPRWLRSEFDTSTSDSRSALSVPLMTQERVVGVVTLVHPKAGWFTMEDLALLTAITITISYSVTKKQKQAARK